MAAASKRLVYILNYVHADDAQHFVHVFRLLDELEALGWAVTLISEKGGRGVQEVFGRPVRYMSERGGLLRLAALAWTLLSLRLSGHDRVFVRISKPAAIVSGLISRLTGSLTFFWLSGAILDYDAEQPFHKRAPAALTRRLATWLVNRFVTGPETMVAYYREHLNLPERKLVLLYNDIDTARFTPALKDRDEGTLEVLLVHRFSPVRRTDFYMPAIVEALNAVAAEGRAVRLRMVGDGDERAALEKQAEAAAPGVEIVFEGAVPNRKVQAFYAASDIFIMPSYREGFPRVVLEAMASGLPVVSTDAGGVRDLFGTAQQAFATDRDDAAAFGANLRTLATDPDLRRRLANENTARVQRFSTPEVARMYDRALSGAPSEDPVHA